MQTLLSVIASVWIAQSLAPPRRKAYGG